MGVVARACLRGGWLVAPASVLVAVDAWRWRWFVHPDVGIARRAADVLLSSDALHVYARVPSAQMGPLAIAMARVPHALYVLVVALMVVPFLVLASRPLWGVGVSIVRRIVWMLVTTLLVAPWAQLAWKGHADDALVLLGAAVMLTAVASRRPGWLVAGWAVAVAGKPTALALAPLLLTTPVSAWAAVALTAVLWGPFLVADPSALLRAGQGVMAVVPGDTLAYLGVPHGRPPVWVRPVQLLASWVGTVLGYLRARPEVGLLCGLAARAVIEPNPAPAYSISLVAIALFVDAGRRVPVTTALAAAGFWTSQPALAGGSGLPRMAFLTALVLWCGWVLSGWAVDLSGYWSRLPRLRLRRAAVAAVAGAAWLAGFGMPAQASTVLRRGSTGDGVRCVQWAVNHLSGAALTYGSQTPVDGQFGSATAGAVQQFQAQYADPSDWATVVDGQVGVMTGTVLREAGFANAPSAWHCASVVPFDADLREPARQRLARVRAELAEASRLIDVPTQDRCLARGPAATRDRVC